MGMSMGTGALIASGAATLTNTTPNSLTYVQWGTEELTIAQGDMPPTVAVVAWLQGKVRAGPGTISVGDRGTAKLQVSFDGGSSWADFAVSSDAGMYLPTTTTSRDLMINATARATGTLTGDLQVRAQCADVNAANDTTFLGGVITAITMPT